MLKEQFSAQWQQPGQNGSLPGSAEWWPDNYDYKKHGWEVTGDAVLIEKHDSVIKLVFALNEPENITELIWFSVSNLLIN